MKRACLVMALVCIPVVARAQARRGGSPVPVPSLVAPTLTRRLGVDIAEALLKSQQPEERQRGFERLSSVGTARALDLLLKVFEPGGAAHSGKDRLIAVRALAPHAAVPAVRELLVRVMVGVGSNPERPEAIDGLIEHAAALALAASGDASALATLGTALRQPGHVADTAKDALLAFPPRSLQPILQARSAATKTLASFLGELGDPRAIPALGDIARSAPTGVRAEAALALAKLGVSETIELARHWVTSETAPELRLAGARILILLGTPDAAFALGPLLSDEATRASALDLAGGASLPGLAATLMHLARKPVADDPGTLWAALGLTGTREAFSFLGGALSLREASSAAALGLALAPSADASATLSHALGVPDTRRVAVRASLVRLIALGQHTAGLEDALAALAKSRDPADIAVVQQATALRSPELVSDLLKHASPDQVRALSRAALLPEAADALAERLISEPNAGLRTALSACLASPRAAERVPTDVLLDLLDAGGLGAPLAAHALAVRDSPTLRPKILALLASDDALLRSHTALGLGRSEEGSALGVLEHAYRFETNDDVRLAIVRALATRTEPSRQRVLDLARTLDGSRAVRDAAALGLAHATPEERVNGPGSVWLDLNAAGLLPDVHTGDTQESPASALIITADGLALPAFADPDGVLLLPALATGPFSLRLAAPVRTDNASGSRQP